MFQYGYRRGCQQNDSLADGCLKGWDYQFWAPLEWSDAAGDNQTPPVPKQLKWLDSWTMPRA